MSYTLERYEVASREHGLNILACGRQKAGKNHFVPTRVYPNDSLTFVLKGRGKLWCGERTYEIGAGQGFMIAEGSEVSYQADGQDPWEYIFVIFRGFESKALLTSIGVEPAHPVFSFSTDALSPSLLALLDTSGAPDPGGYAVLGHFLLAISKLVRQVPGKDRRERTITEAVSYIESNYSSPLTVREIAEHLFIDRTYLYRLFMDAFGIPPKAYLTEYRLSAAAALLADPSLTVDEVAARCGFFDHAHFIRAFAAKNGQTPGQWRASHS